MLDEDGHPAVTLETIHKFKRETKHNVHVMSRTPQATRAWHSHSGPCGWQVTSCKQREFVSTMSQQLPADPPCLYVGPAENCVCRASLMECYMEGKTRPTIPYSMRGQQQAQFPFGKADGSKERENGSRLYELNHWMMLLHCCTAGA